VGTTGFAVQVEYEDTGGWQLVPDTDLPGNSAGFANSPLRLWHLSASAYPRLRPVVALGRSTASDTSPELRDVRVLTRSNGVSSPLVQSGDFESPAAWDMLDTGGSVSVTTDLCGAGASGTGCAARLTNNVGSQGAQRSGYVRQFGTVPADANTLDWSESFYQDSAGARLGIRVGDSVLELHAPSGSVQSSAGWLRCSADISALRGQDLALELFMEDEGDPNAGATSHGAWFSVDDLVIQLAPGSDAGQPDGGVPDVGGPDTGSPDIGLPDAAGRPDATEGDAIAGDTEPLADAAQHGDASRLDAAGAADALEKSSLSMRVGCGCDSTGAASMLWLALTAAGATTTRRRGLRR
jgi:hypothetical protein